jgi:hypothetical protein
MRCAAPKPQRIHSVLTLPWSEPGAAGVRVEFLDIQRQVLPGEQWEAVTVVGLRLMVAGRQGAGTWEGTSMAGQVSVNWLTCDEDGCIGIRLDTGR